MCVQLPICLGWPYFTHGGNVIYTHISISEPALNVKLVPTYVQKCKIYNKNHVVEGTPQHNKSNQTPKISTVLPVINPFKLPPSVGSSNKLTASN